MSQATPSKFCSRCKSSPADRTGVPPADSIVPSPAGVSCGSLPQQDVGQDRLSHSARTTRMKRARYFLSLIYWSLRHRSLSLGRWVAAYEGHSR